MFQKKLKKLLFVSLAVLSIKGVTTGTPIEMTFSGISTRHEYSIYELADRGWNRISDLVLDPLEVEYTITVDMDLVGFTTMGGTNEFRNLEDFEFSDANTHIIRDYGQLQFNGFIFEPVEGEGYFDESPRNFAYNYQLDSQDREHSIFQCEFVTGAQRFSIFEQSDNAENLQLENIISRWQEGEEIVLSASEQAVTYTSNGTMLHSEYGKFDLTLSDVRVNSVPEPTIAGLLIVGSLSLIGFRRRKK